MNDKMSICAIWDTTEGGIHVEIFSFKGKLPKIGTYNLTRPKLLHHQARGHCSLMVRTSFTEPHAAFTSSDSMGILDFEYIHTPMLTNPPPGGLLPQHV